MAKFKSIGQLQRALKKAAKNLLDEKDLRDFAHIAVLERKAGFDKGEAPDGTKWRKLKESTIERKRRKGSPDPDAILVDEGKLKKTGPVRTTKTSAVIPVAKSRTDISQYHNKGTNHVPKREHWGFYGEAINKINKLFTKRLWKKFVQSIQGG